MWILLLLAVLFFLFLTALIENEKWGWATGSLILTGIVAWWVHRSVDLVGWTLENWLVVVTWAGIYIGIGIAWSFAKWFSFLMGFRDAFREAKEAFQKGMRVSGSYRSADSLEEHLRYSRYNGSPLNQKPQASENKSRITAWMAFWPFSFVGTLINDPVRRLFNFLYGQFKALYQRMADHVFRNEEGLK